MSLAAHHHDHESDADSIEGLVQPMTVIEPDREELFGAEADSTAEIEPEPVQVHRNGAVAGVLGLGAALVALAWLFRALATGGAFDWFLVALTAGLALIWLVAFVDSRTPLLVADRHGVRFRLGRVWRGLPWSDIAQVRHLERSGLRDGRLVVVARDEETVLAGLNGRAARAARLSTSLYGAPLAVPLGLTTRSSSPDLAAALESLAAGAVAVVPPEARAEVDSDDLWAADSDELRVDEAPAEPTIDADTSDARVADLDLDDLPEPAERRMPDLRPRLATAINRVSAWFERPPAEPVGETPDALVVDEGHDDELDTDYPVAAEPGADDAAGSAAAVASATPEAVRAARPASRAEVRRETEAPALNLLSAGEETADELPITWGEGVTPIAREGHPVEALVIEDFVVEPAPDPVIGPELRAARTRLGLSVDELAERTRIRSHVIEAIEVDDFVPCGGDFYARGHLRTLCRILGIDAADLLTEFDQRYAHAPLDPRRVFEAELATGSYGTIRSMRGGPNWSILIAAVMALVLLWSVARLVMDAPPALRGDTPVLNGSGGPHAGASAVADPVPVSITAAEVGARIVVRDATGKVVFKGNLAIGEATTLRASPPVRVQSTDGAVRVAVDGQPARAIGEAGTAGQGTFTVQ